MVTVFLRGGLGNQMFQYAAGLALAERNHTELLLDTVFLNDRWPRREFTYRVFDLDIFGLNPRVTFFSKASKKLPIPGLWLGLDLVFMEGREALGIQKIIKEREEHAFDSEILQIKDSVVLWGRWQNAEYFAEVENELREAFRFRHPLKGEAQEIGLQIESSKSISLHVRRGDFGAFGSVVSLMGDTNLAYYAEAADYIGSRVESPHFFVFSDDIDWCRKNLKINFPITYVPQEAAGPKAAFHLELMSRCKHNIIANSTFSWWGAWLNTSPDKIVVAPKKWYADHEAPEGLIPDGWVTL